MIQLTDVTKTYPTRRGFKTVLDGVNLTISSGQKLGILGSNGSGKSTLIRLISGAELPNSGSIKREMTVSWPLAFTGGFQGSLTGADNLRFLCRVYGSDLKDALAFVEDFSELGHYLNEPFKTYSSGMRAKLAFAISMAIKFDCFLIDEVIAVGDHRFRAKCHHELFEKRDKSTIILVSHEVHQIESICNQIAVVENGKLIEFASKETGLQYYSNIACPPTLTTT